MLDHTGQQATFVDRGPCPLCGGMAGAGSPRVVVHDFDQIPVVRCGGCGFLFSDRVFSPEATARYYAKDWGSVWHRCGQAINAPVNAAALKRLVPVGEIRSMLDVGCGYGFLLPLVARKFGWKAQGVEVSAAEATFAREQLQASVTTGTLAQAGLAAASFDLVTCFEVIEHLLDPVSFVRELVQHVKPGGWVVIGTDNFAAPIVKRMGAAFPKWIPHTHVSLFEPATLRGLMERSGLQIRSECSWTNWETSLRSRLRGSQSSKPAREAWSLSNELKGEMNRVPTLFTLRKFINPLCFRLCASRSADQGSLMWIAARKPMA